MEKELNILAISYGRNLFNTENIERKRMELCADEVSSYRMVVFTKHSDNFNVIRADKGLVIYPTQSRTRFHMVFDAIRIGSQIIREDSKKWIITTQDPFEAGLVGYILACRHKMKLNIQEHGDFFSTDAWKKESIINQFRFYFGKWLLRKADTVRVVSKRTEMTMKKIGVSSERIHRLAVRTENISEEKGCAPVDLHMEYPEASAVILSMARFVPQKNLLLLIEAFSEVSQMCPQTVLVLIGSGPEEEKLRNVVKKYNLTKSVIFKEWTDNPQAYMRSADIYALSSNYEGWGRVLIEAMLLRVPVVTTDVGCAGEVLLDGVHGFVVPVGSKKLFSQKLKTLTLDSELRHKLSKTSHLDVLNAHISAQNYTTAWAQILRRTA